MPEALDYETPTSDAVVPRYWSAWASWPLMLAVVYLPYSWLLLEYPWGDYRLSWIKLWPALPGLLVGVVAHGRDAVQFTLMAVFSAAVVATLLFAFRRPRRPLTVLSTAATILILSGLNSCIAHAVFRT